MRIFLANYISEKGQSGHLYIVTKNLKIARKRASKVSSRHSDWKLKEVVLCVDEAEVLD